MTISSNDLPLGTRVKLTFDGERSRYNGIYTVRDTGNMPKGVIDLFVGDFGEQVGQETIEFGRTQVQVQIQE